MSTRYAKPSRLKLSQTSRIRRRSTVSVISPANSRASRIAARTGATDAAMRGSARISSRPRAAGALVSPLFWTSDCTQMDDRYLGPGFSDPDFWCRRKTRLDALELPAGSLHQTGERVECLRLAR